MGWGQRALGLASPFGSREQATRRDGIRTQECGIRATAAGFFFCPGAVELFLFGPWWREGGREHAVREVALRSIEPWLRCSLWLKEACVTEEEEVKRKGLAWELLCGFVLFA